MPPPVASVPAPPSSGASPPRARFASTRWSVVVRAGRADSPDSRAALEHLCRSYWYPLYAHVRRRGRSAHDAEDLTQSFFARLLEKGIIAEADPVRGRFRTFLLTALNHFLDSNWRRYRTQKRGGGLEVISLDAAAAARRFELEPRDGDAPDTAFDRQWALALLDNVLRQLETEFVSGGKGAQFAALKGALAGPRESVPYAGLAERLDMSEAAVKTAVHRLRRRYRVLIEAEIVQTVASPEEAPDELRHLMQILA